MEKNITFYGINTVVNEDLGIKILNKLVEYNIDLYYKNYYGNTALETINIEITKRKNNETFKNKLYNIYDKKYLYNKEVTS